MALTSVSAVTGAPAPLRSLGNLKVVARTVVLPASVTADGDALTAADFGLSVVVFSFPAIFIATDRDDAVLGHYDIANSKLIVYWGNAGTASVLPTATGDLSDYTGQVVVAGY